MLDKLDKVIKSSSKNILKEIGIFGIGMIIFMMATLGKYTVYTSTGITPFIQPVLAIESLSDNQKYNHITIPSINTESIVDQGGLEKGKWIISENTVLYYSLLNNGIKNIFLYAHNKPELFGNIKKLNNGDEVIMQSDNGVKSVYKVYSKEYIKFYDVDKIKTDEKDTITLFTCDGLLDQLRLVVRARKV